MTQIASYGIAFNFEARAGFVRLKDAGGRTWDSPQMDAAQLAALAAILSKGAYAANGWLVAGTERVAVDASALAAMGGESPFPW